MKRIICLFSIMLLAAAAAFADLAKPEPNKVKNPSKSINTTMTILLKSDAKEARLVIPRSQIKQLRAELDDMDDDTANTAAVTGDVSRTQTIVSGTFLSLALVFGGVWFARSGKTATKTGKTLIALTVVALTASAGTFIYANAGPPPEARSITGKMFSQAVHIYKFGSGAIKIETTNDNNGVTLVVPDPQPATNGEE
jgi:hypothetical protein